MNNEERKSEMVATVIASIVFYKIKLEKHLKILNKHKYLKDNYEISEDLLQDKKIEAIKDGLNCIVEMQNLTIDMSKKLEEAMFPINIINMN